jgi:large subunit ribosomal protein L24
MASNIKKDDIVKIITGDSKGKTGKVLRVIKDKSQVIVEGHNRRYKHVRPSKKSPQGGRVQIEQPIHISNVLPVNPKSDKATRVRFETDKKGIKKRIALDGTELSVVKRA